MHYWLPFATRINEFIYLLRCCALILEYISPRSPSHGVRYVGLGENRGLMQRIISVIPQAWKTPPHVIDEQELPGRFNLENKRAQEKETRD